MEIDTLPDPYLLEESGCPEAERGKVARIRDCVNEVIEKLEESGGGGFKQEASDLGGVQVLQ